MVVSCSGLRQPHPVKRRRKRPVLEKGASFSFSASVTSTGGTSCRSVLGSVLESVSGAECGGVGDHFSEATERIGGRGDPVPGENPKDSSMATAQTIVLLARHQHRTGGLMACRMSTDGS